MELLDNLIIFHSLSKAFSIARTLGLNFLLALKSNAIASTTPRVECLVGLSAEGSKQGEWSGSVVSTHVAFVIIIGNQDEANSTLHSKSVFLIWKIQLPSSKGINLCLGNLI